MDFFDKLDAFLMPNGCEVTELEKAARICLRRSIESSDMKVCMVACSMAMSIRSLPNWTPYQAKSVP